jgi:LysM repeat protein
MLAMGLRLVVVVLCVALASGCSLSADRRAQALTSRAPSHRAPPTTTTQPTTTTTGPPFLYRVRPGDTLSGITAKFRVAELVIMAHNHLTTPDLLREGQVLSIPWAPPLALTITPAQSKAGQAFHFTLRGAVPSETITFTIVSPTGRYTGGPHITPDGTVTATYQTTFNDPAGMRTVLAVGDKGTHLTAQFNVTAARSATTP